MKGIHGVIIAVALALIAGFVNFVYLTDQAKPVGVESFVAVRSEKKIKVGQQFRATDLELISVPIDRADGLRRIGCKDLELVTRYKATRDYEGGEPILNADLKTVSHDQLPLQTDEVAYWVPVRGLVTNQIIPGKTQVLFRLPKVGPTPTVAATAPQLELVGPFDVLSVGNRRGDEGTMKSENVRASQENILTIRGTRLGANQLDDKTMRVINYLDKNNNRPLDVMLCPEQPQAKKL